MLLKCVLLLVASTAVAALEWFPQRWRSNCNSERSYLQEEMATILCITIVTTLSRLRHCYRREFFSSKVQESECPLVIGNRSTLTENIQPFTATFLVLSKHSEGLTSFRRKSANKNNFFEKRACSDPLKTYCTSTVCEHLLNMCEHKQDFLCSGTVSLNVIM